MWIQKPWGKMKTLAQNLFGRYTIKILVVNPGMRLSDQRHKNRKEWWMVLSGNPTVELERLGQAPQTVTLTLGQSLGIPQGSWHRLGCSVSSARPVKILEISTGIFDEEDIERRADDYGRS